MSDIKRLYKIRNGKICGVCGGIAEYLNIDPTILRIIWVVVTAFTGFLPGLLAYAICALIMPFKDQAAPTPPAE